MGEELDPAYWEQRYRSHSHHRLAGPNPQLVEEVRDLAPGTALEAGCGEGANALWLAGRGWRVTAADVSPTALCRAREHAATLGQQVADRVDWVEADLIVWQPPREAFDLVTSHYVHPAGPRDELLRRLEAAVAPGGTLLVVDHDHADEHALVHVSPDELAAALAPDRWAVEVAESRVRRDDDGHGGEVTLRDVVLRARRRR